MRLVRRRGAQRDRRGQSLVEFALVIPVFLAVLLSIFQFGLILWSQVTIAQVARDTGRWAATQTTPCASGPAAAAAVQTQANAISNRSSLLGYPAYPVVVTTTYAGTPPTVCPPPDNTGVWYVHIKVSHQIPMFLPMLPATWTVGSEVEYRMEPVP